MGMLKKDRARLARKQRIRKRIFGTTARPRLSIFRSAQYTYAQIIDDEVKKTIVSCSSAEKELSNKLKSTSSVEAAKTVGQEIANRAKAKKIAEAGYVLYKENFTPKAVGAVLKQAFVNVL
jgi:large subunit ribosomal protein L18